MSLSLISSRFLRPWVIGCLFLFPLAAFSQIDDSEDIEIPEDEAIILSLPVEERLTPTASFSGEMLERLFLAERAYWQDDFDHAFETYWQYAQALNNAQFAEYAVRLLMVEPYLQWLISENILSDNGEERGVFTPYVYYRRYIMTFPSDQFAGESTRPLIFVMSHPEAMDSAKRAQWRERLLRAADYWFSLESTSPAAFGMVVSTHLILGDTATIPGVFKEALETHPELTEKYWNVARGVFRGIPVGSEYDKPELVAQLAQLSPKSAEAHMVLAELAVRQQDNQQVMQELEKAIALRPDWNEPVILKVKLLLLANQVDGAKSVLIDFNQKYSDNKETKLLLGKLYVALGDDEGAYELYRQLSIQYPEDPTIAMQAGQLAFKLEQYEKTEEHLHQVLLYETSSDKKDQALVGLVESGQRSGRYQDIPDWISQIENPETRLISYRSYAGYIYLYDPTRIDEATTVLSSAYELSEGELRLGYAYMLSSFLRETEQDKKLSNFLRTALAKDPNDPLLLYEAAMVAEREEDFNRAEGALRKLIEVQPDYAHGYNALGYSFADRNIRLEEAKELLETAIRLAPDDPYIQDSVGWLEFRLGNYPKAIEWLMMSFEATRSAEVAAHLGEVYWAMGEQEKAKSVWKAGLRIDANHPVLLKTIKRVYGQAL